MADESTRPGAEEIYEAVKHDAAKELRRTVPALAFSGVLAGATLGFSGLAAAAALAVAGDDAGGTLIAAALYPIGFVTTIIGRAQLFTENTLYPMTLVLDERRHLRGMLRLWGVVYAANIAGALAFALLVVLSGALGQGIVDELTGLGRELSSGDWWPNLWSGVVAGWLLALVAWLVEASDSTVARVAVIWGLTFLIGLAALDHCVSTTAQVLASLLDGGVPLGRFVGWLAGVTLGNVAGGVVIVALLNYGQVRAGR